MQVSVGSESTKTKIVELADDERFEVSRPTIKMVPIKMIQGMSARFWLAKPNGIFSFEAEYEGQYASDNVYLCRFRITSQIEKNQRRGSYRLPIVMRATALPIDANGSLQPNKIPITTVNLSEDGICFTAFATLHDHQNIVLQLRLEDSSMMILSARVVRIQNPLKKSDPTVYAAQFQKVTKRDQIQLSRFILTRQILERKEKE
ncbi:MAG: PilZ domain-containing protein [Bacillota bacterium]